MNLGLLGCGSIAYWIHLRALRSIPGATLVAAADPDPAARERANRLAGVPVYEEPAELLGRNDIAAVVDLHSDPSACPLAIAAASAGKHFYLEKPIATTAAEARDIIEAAAQAGVTGAIGFNRRLHPLYQQARDLLAGRPHRPSTCRPDDLLRAYASRDHAILETTAGDGRGGAARAGLPSH